ncbi:MAG: hypothetical protein H6995_13190 [Pseudomonadales bacterium]|nr:hypothetical protein [Pseudomonadales bacterium]MCP5215953.1 hypothetical protein [Pseudomonadales bacterium]
MRVLKFSIVLKIVFKACAVAVLAALVSAVIAAELKDPTQPAYYTAGDNAYLSRLRESYRLHSVLVSAGRRIAVINGKRVREGEKVAEAVVQKISKSSVRLAIPGAVFDISLAGENVKKIN